MIPRNYYRYPRMVLLRAIIFWFPMPRAHLTPCQFLKGALGPPWSRNCGLKDACTGKSLKIHELTLRVPLSRASPLQVTNMLWISLCSLLQHSKIVLGFEDLSICSTGFQGIELTHTAKAVRLIGKLHRSRSMSAY